MRPDRRVEGRQVRNALDELHPSGLVEDPLDPLAHKQVVRGDDNAERRGAHVTAGPGVTGLTLVETTEPPMRQGVSLWCYPNRGNTRYYPAQAPANDVENLP
jgi:hypothetical protein